MTMFNGNFCHHLYQLLPESELNDNQREIALLFALGTPLEEIAEQKKIKPITVRKHIDAVKDALGGISLSNVRIIIFMRIITSISISIQKSKL